MATLIFPNSDMRKITETSAKMMSFVKDSGIYLCIFKPKKVVIYANGYDPRKSDVWDRAREAVGGDDFVEEIEVDDEIRKYVSEGWDFMIKVTPDTLQTGFQKPKNK